LTDNLFEVFRFDAEKQQFPMHQGVVIGIRLTDDVSALEMAPAVLEVMPCEKTTGIR
jgi:hypothetical protein